MFAFANQCVYAKADAKLYENAENIKFTMLQSLASISITDYGKTPPQTYNATLRQMAKQSSITKAQGRLLARIVNYFQPKTIVELGTHLGVSTAYLASTGANVFTIEGSPATAAVAQQNFEKADITNVKQYVGAFEEQLPRLLADVDTIDLAFIDGNHRYQPTLDYFTSLLTKATTNSIFILHDIYHSPEMARAWAEIKNHPQVTATADFYALGVVFFKTELSKQHFVLRY